MKKLAKHFIMSAIVTFLLICLPACTHEESSESGSSSGETVTFYGVENVELSVADDGYAFDGVYAENQKGNKLDVSVDASDVQFGTAGKYTVYFTAGEKKESAFVYVYGTPTIETAGIEVGQTQISQKAYQDLIVAKDTFGNRLKVEAVTNFTVDEYGLVSSGEQTIKFQAVDKKNNVAEKEITVNVLPAATLYEKETVTVDYANAFYTFDVEFDSPVVAIRNSATEVVQNRHYRTNGDNDVMLMPSLIEALGVGTHKLGLEFADGISLVDLTVTNDEPFNYTLDKSLDKGVFEQFDLIALPKIVRHEASIQDFTVKYYVSLPSESTKSELADFTISLEESGSYTYSMEILKGSTVDESVALNFTVASVEEAYAKNLINREGIIGNGGNGALETAFEEERTIEYFDGGANAQITLPGLSTSCLALPTASSLSHILNVDDEVVAKAQKAGLVNFNFTCYTKCGFGIYTKNNQDGYELIAYVGEAENVIERKVKIAMDLVINGLYIDVFCADQTAPIYFTKVNFTSFSTADMVAEETLGYATTEKASVTYEESVTLDGNTYNAIKITAENTKTDGWAQANYLFVNSGLFALKGENTRLYMKFYADCSLVLADWQGNGKGQINWVETSPNYTVGFREYTLDLADANNAWALSGMRICMGNGGTANVYITELSFKPPFNTGDMVNEETLDYFSGEQATVTYSESVSLDGGNYDAITVTANNTTENGWSQTHYAHLASNLFALRGEKTKLYIKLYADCSVILADGQGNAKVDMNWVNHNAQYANGDIGFLEYTLDLADANNAWALSGVRICIGNGSKATISITELQFVD